LSLTLARLGVAQERINRSLLSRDLDPHHTNIRRTGSNMQRHQDAGRPWPILNPFKEMKNRYAN
jgi:hypothetical protein